MAQYSNTLARRHRENLYARGKESSLHSAKRIHGPRCGPRGRTTPMLADCAAHEAAGRLSLAAECYSEFASVRDPPSSTAVCGLRRVQLLWMQHNSPLNKQLEQEVVGWRIRAQRLGARAPSSRTAAGRCAKAVVAAVEGWTAANKAAPSTATHDGAPQATATKRKDRPPRDGGAAPPASQRRASPAVQTAAKSNAALEERALPTAAVREQALRLVDQGRALASAGRMGEAVAALSRSSRLWPELHEAKLWWGVCESHQVRTVGEGRRASGGRRVQATV